MATVVESSPGTTPSEIECLAFVREVLRIESEAIDRVRDRLDGSIVRAAELIVRSRGSVIVTGMGKAGHVGRKLAATFSSTGTAAFPMHPAEAVHGDLGQIRAGDVVIALSRSGETEEVLRLLPSIRRLGASLVAITEQRLSSLGRAAEITMELGPIEEACPLGLAPSASTTTLMAVGDALALLVSRLRDFRAEDFALFHPGGSLGRQLSNVEDLMRTGKRFRKALSTLSVREVFVGLAGPRRRSGAVLIVDGDDRLVGIFTDSDLARLFEQRKESLFDGPISAVMTPDPIQVQVGTSVGEAVEIFKDRKISELPVTDLARHPVGLIDLTDLIGLVPAEPGEE